MILKQTFYSGFFYIATILMLIIACGKSSKDNSVGSVGYANLSNGFLEISGDETLEFGMALDGESSYLAGGMLKTSESDYGLLFLMKLNSSIELDSSFAEGGVFQYDLTDRNVSSKVTAAAIHSSDEYFICISTSGINGAINQAVILKLGSDGAVDEQFGTNGELAIDYRSCKDIAISDQNVIVILTESSGSGEIGFYFLNAYDLDGKSVTSFGDNGEVELILDADKLAITADAILPIGVKSDFVAFPKYDLSGKLDRNFGNQSALSGYQYMAGTSVLQEPKAVRSIILKDDGSILIATHTGRSTSISAQDWGFTTATPATGNYVFDSYIDHSFTTNNSTMNCLEEYSDKFVAGGHSYEDNNKSAYLLFMNQDGTVDESIGEAGIIEFSVSDIENHSEIVGVWEQNSHLYVIGNVSFLDGSVVDKKVFIQSVEWE